MAEISINEMRQRFLTVASASVYDVLDKMGYPNQCLDLSIRPLRDDMKLAGPAFTILGTREPLYGEEFPCAEFDNFALFDRLEPGCVVVINAEEDRLVGHWGEMMSYGARNRGASGVVIDGGTRDKAGILKIANWSCFARYTSPIESEQRWRPRKSQVPIFVSGTLTRLVRVDPGDWIVGDVDGVIVIPKKIAYDVLWAVEDIERREELSRQELAAGAPIREVFEKYQRA